MTASGNGQHFEVVAVLHAAAALACCCLTIILLYLYLLALPLGAEFNALSPHKFRQNAGDCLKIIMVSSCSVS